MSVDKVGKAELGWKLEAGKVQKHLLYREREYYVIHRVGGMNVGLSKDILAGERASTWKGSVHNNNNVYTFATSWYIARVNDPLQ